GQLEQALALDGALGVAWLGRGLCRIRSGEVAGGREDLQVAAALEPQRAFFRSYLGKAFAEDDMDNKALHEWELAQQLDPSDPTPWLYRAIFFQRHNRVNEAIHDLERSVELNDNRRVYRSR